MFLKLSQYVFLLTLVSPFQLTFTEKLAFYSPLDYILLQIHFIHLPGLVSESYCPDSKSFVIGAKVRTSSEPWKSEIHPPAITSIQFVCSEGNRTRRHSISPLVLERQFGEWGEGKECPNGEFATGIVLHMLPVQFPSLTLDESELVHYHRGFYKLMGSFDVSQLGKDTYIAGVTLNCADEGTDYIEEMLGNPSGGGLAASHVTLGETTKFDLRVHCVNQRALTGMGVEGEAVTAYDEGERVFPLRMRVKCSPITPSVFQSVPEVTWEKVVNVSCEKTGQSSLSCKVGYLQGLALKKSSRNGVPEFKKMELNKIRRSFVLALHSAKFKREWQLKHKMTLDDLFKEIHEEDTFTPVAFATTTTTFENGPLPKELSGNENATRTKDVKDVDVQQLVIHWGVYKLYVDLFKMGR